MLTETSQKEHDRAVQEQKIKDISVCAESHSEIETRSKMLVSKCSVALSTLNDFEVLEIKKGVYACLVERFDRQSFVF